MIAEDYPEDLDACIAFLGGAAAGDQALKDLIKFKHSPVGVREFIESKSFMAKAGVIWPEVMLALETLNDGAFDQSVLTGAIGSQKQRSRSIPKPISSMRCLACATRTPNSNLDRPRKSSSSFNRSTPSWRKWSITPAFAT